jgi:hypothetical protein
MMDSIAVFILTSNFKNCGMIRRKIMTVDRIKIYLEGYNDCIYIYIYIK